MKVVSTHNRNLHQIMSDTTSCNLCKYLIVSHISQQSLRLKDDMHMVSSVFFYSMQMKYMYMRMDIHTISISAFLYFEMYISYYTCIDNVQI